jgi:transcriptional antiterminator NusG
MHYYAIHVLTDSENDFIRRVQSNIGSSNIISPKRVLSIRRKGKARKEKSPVFPGYVFLGTDDDLLSDLDTYWTVRKTPGFLRYLRENTKPTALAEKDLNLLRHFMSFGEYADTSKVFFDEDDRIVVLEGPLKGLEGRIVKVDRRKGRAKVSLDMCETGFLIDLGFTAVERVKSGGNADHEDD